MIAGILNRLFGRDAARVFGAARSKAWPKTRADHLRLFPKCQACGGTKDLEVHHIRPFHLWPELELDRRNLMTLCGESGRGCHLRIGHLLDYRSWNYTAREDAAAFLSKVRMRPTTRTE